MSLLDKIKLLEKKKDNPDQLSLDLDGADDKRSKAQKFTDKINKKNKNRKEFKFDPKTKERQTFRGKITSGPRKGEGYTIFRRDGGDVKKGVDKGVLPKAAKGAPIDVKSPAHKDLFKRYNKGESKATQFMIDLAKDDRKARGLGKRAERVKDASGGKKTGSLRKGNLSLPGDRTGAYSRTKAEIEFNKALKKARGNTEGDLPKETPQSVRDYAKKVRDKRIKKYKLPDTSFDAKTKFSQKQFDKSIGGAKKPTSPAAPGLFGKGDTKGQMNVKGMERKAFKITKPKDIKLPKSFTDFQRNLQDYKDRDLPGGPRKTGRTSFSGSPSGSRFDPDIGMADDDSARTKVVKQSEVSKQAKNFTKNIDQQRQTTTPSKSDVNRKAQNRIDTKKANAFKKTAAYKNIAQGTDAQGNYLTPEQRKANFIKLTKQNKEPKNKTIKHNKNFGTSKTATGNNKVTTGMGRGATSNVTGNKDFANFMKNNKINNTTTGNKKVNLPKFGKKSGVTNPSFMKKVTPNVRKALKPTAKAFMKAGPLGKLAAGALVVGGAVYGANQIRKAFAGAGKPKAPPVVKGDALRYNTGPKKGEKKYFDISKMKTKYFTPSDFRDKKGNIDAGFGKPDRDEKLIKRLKSTK